MKIKNRNKNDRCAFFNLNPWDYRAMSNQQRREWRKPEVLLGSLADILDAQKGQHES